MQKNIFSPKIQNQDTVQDGVKQFLHNSALAILVSVFVLLPIFFIPDLFVALTFTKSYLVITGVVLAIILLSFSVLRSGRMKISFPLGLSLFWLFSLVALASALLSGDKNDALFGNILEGQTAGFFVLMALIMTVSLAFEGAKLSLVRLFMGLGITALLLQIYHILRIIFGPEFLSFGMFGSNTSSLFGSLNDLAIFSGLVIITTLVILQQISTGIIGKIVASLLVVFSLILLMVINFFAVWIVVGFFALVTLLYILVKDSWFANVIGESKYVSKTLIGLVAVVCVASASFVVAGDSLGSAVSKVTNVSYLEVRPSVGATFDIARSVYSENALLGIGPNRFEDAWRLYKNPVINETLFWNTNFNAGSGFVTTVFVTSGVAGGAVLIFFIFALVYTMYKLFLLMRASQGIWYLLGTLTTVSAIYLWLMSFIYAPGTVLMLFTALMTGLVFAIYNTVKTTSSISINVANGRRYGILLMASVLLVVVTTSTVFYDATKRYLSQVKYAEAFQAFEANEDLAELDKKLIDAQQLNEQDIFVAERTRLRLIEINRLVGLTEPKQAEIQRLQSAMAEGIALAERTIALDPTNPYNYLLLSGFYGFLDPRQYEGVDKLRDATLDKAHELDPLNPEIYFISAQLKARFGELTEARADLVEAVQLKRNYTDALFLLAQIDIQEGNTESAVENTLSIISIEPDNPTRYFQLGVLLSTINDLKGAIEAFETAVMLDNNYANARYFLALTYLDDNRPEEALEQLKIVETTNQDNQELIALISQIENGTFEKPGVGLDVPVDDGSAVSSDGEVVTSSESPDTDLVKSVNSSVTEEGNSSDNQAETEQEPAQ